ncbi:MAG: phosphate transport system regulatory protein PhoU [Chthonomonadaceae bacterium]|uniref:Phosphate transport system regulatory protein PhoU n=1 Tax=Candidatus Nitrosymbiomonas proteolyticus TaxID=2608984 RepID=A0A809R7S9_9BACT|nr:phosphate transport system regulatory protein PhoU [Candidatus Nitrosymbiomonas proteolyticus]
MTLRQNYDEQLLELQSMVTRMGGIATEMVRSACAAIQTGDLENARATIERDNEVDELEEQITLRAVVLVMKESPVAGDLKMLTSALGVVGEIEKAADHAVKLARRATKLTGQFPAELKANLAELAELSIKQFTLSLKLFMEFDGDLAEEIIRNDKVVDELYTVARNRVIELIRKSPESADVYVRSIDALHALEHVADHATEIAERLRLHFSNLARLAREN